jgi:hypothetical protein
LVVVTHTTADVKQWFFSKKKQIFKAKTKLGVALRLVVSEVGRLAYANQHKLTK